jgi:hypothetical protein
MKVKEAMLQIHYYQYELPVLIIMKLFSYIYIYTFYLYWDCIATFTSHVLCCTSVSTFL